MRSKSKNRSIRQFWSKPTLKPIGCKQRAFERRVKTRNMVAPLRLVTVDSPYRRIGFSRLLFLTSSDVRRRASRNPVRIEPNNSSQQDDYSSYYAICARMYIGQEDSSPAVVINFTLMILNSIELFVVTHTNQRYNILSNKQVI